MPLDAAAKPEIVHSACPHDCPSTCALEVERLDAKTIGRVRGAKDNSYTQGVVCSKVARYAERVHHPDRLTKPLKRVGKKGVGREAFEEISWDEALDTVAAELKARADKLGSETIFPYFYAGTMGLVQRDGIERLRHAMKYSRQLSTICSSLSDSGWLAGAGVKYGADSREMADSELIVVWGGNPVSTQVNVMNHIAKARKKNDAKLVVIDPYRTPTAEAADVHLMVRPGTDAALACAAMHVILREGLDDTAYLEKFTDVTRAELVAHLEDRGPDWAAAITGLSVEEIEEFARLYAGTKKAYIRLGYGFSRSRNGAVSMHAASCLPAVTGAWQERGGGALYANGGIYNLDVTLIMGLDARDKSTRLLDQSRLGPILTGDPTDLGDGPPVTAIFIQNTNPMNVCPELGLVKQGFERDDLFICVHEQFMTETAAMADVVLPATTFLEHDDVYIAGGHTHLQVTKAVIEPLGECRSNHQVICALAERLGADHPGFRMTEWEIMDATLKTSGYPGAEEIHDNHWHDCAKGSEAHRFTDGFGHPDGKFRFKPDWAAVGEDHTRLPKMVDYCGITDNASEEHPFRLVTAPARTFLNSSFTETPGSKEREKRPEAMIHPDDCKDLGLSEDGLVRIGNGKGSVVVHVKPFDGVQRGVLVVESIFPNHAFVEGIGINLLVSADAGPPKGGAVFHDTAVWLKAA